MATSPFEEMAGGGSSLLGQVEAIVVDSHRRWYEAQGRRWSRPIAYHWLRYEDPMPIQRLAEGVEKLNSMGATFAAAAVDKACAKAAEMGFSN